MRKAMKVVVVSAIAAMVGWSGGTLLAGKPRKARAMLLQSGAGEAVHADQGSKQWHSSFLLDSTNLGGPGELGFLATFRINLPRTAGLRNLPDEINFVVMATIRDKAGKVWVNGEPIARGVERAGVGQWQQDFSALYSLPRGRYQVELDILDPWRVTRDRDGKQLLPYRKLTYSSCWYDVL